MTVNRPLVINHGAIETTILTPQEDYLFYQQLKNGFYKSLPPPTEGFAGDDEPSTKAELLMKFLGYVIQSDAIESEKRNAVKLIIGEFETRFLMGQDVHAFAATALSDEEHPTTLAKVQNHLIKNYYMGKVYLDGSFGTDSIGKPTSALFNAATTSKVLTYAIFGGQGNTEDYFEELRDIYHVYHGLIAEFLQKVESEVNSLISSTAHADRVYTHGFDLINWLEDPSATPSSDLLLSIPISCPLICAIQLCHYIISCKVMGVHPGQFRDMFKGTTGHSQGLVTALVMASSDSWKTFYSKAIEAIKFLFFLAVRCVQAYPSTSLSPSMVKDSEDNGEGEPGPMLSIRDLSIEQVNSFVADTNRHLPAAKQINISLINGARNVVVTGPPESLYGLNLNLRKAKAPTGLNQARVPYSKRKLSFSSKFLPITSPFHSHLLAPAEEPILEDFKKAGISFDKKDITIPVFDTYTGKDLRDLPEESTASRVVTLITTLPVEWVKATNFKSTHIIDFGPGGISGLGALTLRNKEGTGVRIIVAGALGPATDPTEIGYKQELFESSPSALKFAPNWLESYKPKLVKTKAGKVYVDTKFSRLLSRPPLMVPGMTPTTVSPEFVAATINAGYHVEIAGGGYFARPQMMKALEKVAAKIPPGCGIGINLIYVNPRMLQWGIPMIKDMRERGFPIQSLTIGAGVPSLEVASEYIETLHLTHLGLKPGSVDAISQCIKIAKAYPHFPIVLQWTGGRGGGHHSFEDFHQPILQMYGKIRSCSNIILVAGSGFGSAEDTYPYLTGSWSKKFNYPEMPFDGFLFGSRVMVAKEAKTSPAAKKLIASCPGVPDSQWESTYVKPTGGILTVQSEMGEPIHKIATRGVLFWKEMDDTIFSLPKAKMLDALTKKRSYIISKLNSDFQKPWFGKNSDGPCDLKDMTYKEVAERCVELMYVRKSKRWIDSTLRNFTGTFLRRVEQRFSDRPTTSVIQRFEQLEDPDTYISKVFEKYPQACTQIISAEDCDYFISMCLNPAQKPVPFVPVLNEKFEFFFKKDSLWQSEDLDAVVDGDVQRTCILQGPVSTQFATKVDEPIKDILDGINEGHIKRLLKDEYYGDISKVPVVEYFTNKPVTQLKSLDDVTISKSGNDSITFKIGSQMPDADKWFELLAGDSYNWRHAFFSSSTIVQGYNHVTNPARKVFSPQKHLTVKVSGLSSGDASSLVISAYLPVKRQSRQVINVSIHGSKINLQLIESRTHDHKPVALELYYTYNPKTGFAPISEIMEGRNERIKEFYWKVWFGAEDLVNLDIPIDSTFRGEPITISSKDVLELTHSVGNSCEYFVPRSGRTQLVPMDFAIIIGWKAIMKAIFPKAVDGDILKLVHLSNSYRMMSGVAPLQVGDKVSSKADIASITNGPTGKTVKVVGHIYRGSEEVMQVISTFFYRGNYTDFSTMFKNTVETPVQVKLETEKDVAVLKSKEWFDCTAGMEKELLGKVLTFRLTSVYKYKTMDMYSYVSTKGAAYYELPTMEVKKVATVEYEAGDSFGNPVVEYLTRNGKPIEQPVLFENHIPLAKALYTKSPGSNESYATVSGDFNPIHVSKVFSRYADLPNTITHGMFTSASIRSLVEMYAADGVAPRVCAYSVDFVGMVLPNDELSTTLEHIGMINGRKIIKIETKKIETDEVVLTGQAEIDQPITTFVFTGQGSQEQGMGMDLYKNSEVARAVWDRADRHLIDTYGFSILDIVRNNPKELTVHFGGPKGRAVRENYITMMFEYVDPDGNLKSEKIFKSIDTNTDSYTFRSPNGLLAATQFTQPALTLMEKAAFEDMKSKGLIPEKCMFAGHSLGEYSALSSIANVMPIESLVDVVFYRGMTMQVAVPRDSLGRSNYGMIAVDPRRVNKTFSDEALRFVIEHIDHQTGWLLEIVNYNVENQQYVAAGDLRALDTLTNTLNFVKIQKIDITRLLKSMTKEKVAEELTAIVAKVSKDSLAKPQPITLKRGFACIPLRGISVPFHSSYLRSGVKPFKRFLVKKIPKSAIKPACLINRYIPNLTGRPFKLTKDYFQYVYKLTHSDKIKEILDNWESYEKA